MFQKDDVEKLSAQLGEPSWVLDRRLHAWDAFSKLELPGEREEPWRYTSLKRLKFKLDSFAPLLHDAGLPISKDQEDLVKQEGERGGYIIQRDGQTVLREASPELSDKGVILTDLASAILGHEELVRKYLFARIDHQGHLFNALHAALFTGGTFLYVPKGVTLALPIETQHWIDRAGVALFPHTLVVVEEGAEVTYFERYRSLPIEGDSMICPATEVSVGAGARVSTVVLEEFDQGVWNFHTHRTAVDRDATYRNLVVTLGGRVSRQEVETRMEGKGSSIQMLGLYFAEAGQHFDFRTLQDHAGPFCNSDLLYKGALKDSSHTVYSGLIHVRPEGMETDAYQTNRNLVLSDDANADSKPELEIENNDVRCSHGASVGQLNEEEIFYLQSRGIEREQAETLIVNGFFEDVVSKVGQPELREVLSGAIHNKLGGVRIG